MQDAGPEWLIAEREHDGCEALCCARREGSVVVHFWLVLSVPESLAEKVNPDYVNNTLYTKLKAIGDGDTARFEGYLLSIPSLAITGEMQSKMISKQVLIIFLIINLGMFNIFSLIFVICAECDAKDIDLLKASFGMTHFLLRLHCFFF